MLAKGGTLVFFLFLAFVSPTAFALDKNGKALRTLNNDTNSGNKQLKDEPRKLSIVRGLGYYQSGRSSSSKGSKSSKSSKGGGGGQVPSRRGDHALRRCQGDCDSDDDCASGLKCFQRGPYAAVPGCVGGEHDSSPTDYCVLASAQNPMIEDVGSDGHPTHAYPLGRCQGDCDNDRDCGSGLVCFQRTRFQAVPGCRGGEHDSSRTDYCIRASSAPHPSPPRPTPRPTPRPHRQPTPRPTPRPHRQPTPRPNPSPTPEVEYVGSDGKPSSTFPLGLCEGDCDYNSDCAPGLVCFQRTSLQAVPGCRGGEHDSTRTDYCIRGASAPDPGPSTKPSPRPTPRPNPQSTPMIEYIGNDGHPSSKFPLSVCQGDCDSDRDCRPGLKCFQRSRFQAVPGCRGGENDSSRTDYCIASGSNPNTPRPTPRPNPRPTPGPPDNEPRLEIVGNDGSPSSAYPLGACQGDCDDDDDCEYGLFCKQRSRYDPVTGCRGGTSDSTKTDYCAPLHPDQETPEGTIRLKLYWEKGYTWQEETRERKWCMTYDYDGWPDTDGICWYGEDSRSCNVDQIHLAKCRNDNRQRFIFVDLTGNDVLIKLGNGKNQCLQRYRREIFIRTCDANNSLQRWFALSGSFDGDKFEISQKDFGLQCVTTAHHPKAGEVVELHSCRATRAGDSESSYWNKY